jgi:hypothetical protein
MDEWNMIATAEVYTTAKLSVALYSGKKNRVSYTIKEPVKALIIEFRW